MGVRNKQLELGGLNPKDKLSKILSQVNWREWEIIVKKEPEWEHMKSFLDLYGFGPFVVTMLVTCLNDYLLKGKSEIAYWPKIRQLLEAKYAPRSTDDLYGTLRPFYKKERMFKTKIKRLKRFLDSRLAKKLWCVNPKEASKDFLKIGEELSRVMRPKSEAKTKPEKKTIVFAMKGLGLALLMAGEYKFNFNPIPIPVDLRVRRLTKRVEVRVRSDDEIRDFGADVLVELKKEDSRINMIHLDSLIWQISPMEKTPMEKIKVQEYFESLGNPKVGESLCALLF